MNRTITILAVFLAFGGCATQPASPPETAHADVAKAADRVAMFSAGPAGGLPQGWTPMVIFKQKKQTHYQLVPEQDGTVLRAFADRASSGLMQHVSIDVDAQPWLHWRWKIGQLGNKFYRAEDVMGDAPARIILGFDGDKDSLPFNEQILFETAKIITGHDFPYATLMYEWHRNSPVEAIIQSRRSSRIRALVVESGPGQVGTWREFSRNIVEDFEQAYGEKPGKLIGIGILTDTDYTGEIVETWYGDLRLRQHKDGISRAAALQGAK